MYEECFLTKLNNLWKNGWYEENKNRTNLDWLYKELPGQNDKVYLPLNKKRVAVWCHKEWAFGRFYGSLIKYLSDNYECDFLDWNDYDLSKKFLNNDWKNYDIILGNSCMVRESTIKKFRNKDMTCEMLNKMIITIHSPEIKNDGTKYSENVSPQYKEGPVFTGISKEIVNKLQKNGINSIYSPSGVDIDNFNFIKTINKIETVGFIGSDTDDGTNYVKRQTMFKEILEKTTLNGEFIYNKPLSDKKKMYENIDMLICTSVFEGGPLGVFEAIACGIPVISTKVGNVNELKNIKTFETVEEAVEIINYLNGDETLLQDYITKLTSEVVKNWSWNVIYDKYWKNIFEHRLKNNTDIVTEVVAEVVNDELVIKEL